MILVALAPYVAFTLLIAFDPMFVVICALIVLLVGFAWMLNPALRITITDTHLHVRQGLAGESVPLAQITAVEALLKADRRQELRRGPALSSSRRVLLNRATGPALRVRYHGRKGAHELVFSASNPAQVAELLTSSLAQASTPPRTIPAVDEVVFARLSSPQREEAMIEQEEVAATTTTMTFSP